MAAYGIGRGQGIVIDDLDEQVLVAGQTGSQSMVLESALVLVNRKSRSAGLYHFPDWGDVSRDHYSEPIVTEMIAMVEPDAAYSCFAVFAVHERTQPGLHFHSANVANERLRAWVLGQVGPDCESHRIQTASGIVWVGMRNAEVSVGQSRVDYVQDLHEMTAGDYGHIRLFGALQS